jgi:hypothetical protein
MAMERSLILPQLQERFNIFLRSLRTQKTATNSYCADCWRAKNSDQGKTLPLVQKATNTATLMC